MQPSRLAHLNLANCDVDVRDQLIMRRRGSDARYRPFLFALATCETRSPTTHGQSTLYVP